MFLKTVFFKDHIDKYPYIEGNVDFQTVMREAQNEQLAMENDKRSRANNLILHGVAELINCDGQQTKQDDDNFIKTLIATPLGLNVTHKLVHRLGKRNPANEQSKRPMKLVMLNEEDKDRLLDNLKTLKGNEIYKGTSDHTIQERNLIKQWVDKAKRANEEEPDGTKYVWKIRGTPKNGISRKKFLKKNTNLRV